MNGSKKKTSSANRSRWREAITRYLSGPGRWLLWIGVLVGLFVLGAWLGWQVIRDRVLFSETYLVQKEHIFFVSPQPEWVRSDVIGDAFRTAGRDGPLYLWQDRLCQQLADAFAQHPWVARVERIARSYPARIEVQLQWRRPVCTVLWQQQLFPVDGEGTLLPGADFSAAEAARYPRLLGVSTPPPSVSGARWQDGRVIEGAQIAAALGPVWEKFRLSSIRAVPLTEGSAAETLYELWTHGGSRIIWGLGPTVQRPAEPTVADKIARLQRYVQEHGALDTPQGPQTLDLRMLPAAPEQTKETPIAPKAT